MKLTLKIKLMPTADQLNLINRTMDAYVDLVNNCAADMITFNEYGKFSSANTQAELPSVLKNQGILDAKSVFKKYNKTGVEAILKRPIAVWNNQNYCVKDDCISFPVMLDGKSKRIDVQAIIPEHIKVKIADNNLGTLRITKKNKKLIAQIAIEIPEIPQQNSQKVMGVDLGILCPAVCVTDAHEVKFIGNGRRNKYLRRHFKAKRKKLGKKKKLNAIKKLNHKENRIMQDIDHKLSRSIIQFAVKNNVGIIKFEKLANIRKSTRKSRKNNYSIHTWSFYRLASFIEYKAKLAGIRVIYVNPAYTSQTCPLCGHKHKAQGRLYACDCGYRQHRDLVGAINIYKAPEVSGNSLSA